jgi:hypothetical protein
MPMTHHTRRLLRPLLIALALIFLFEAWLWDRLQPIVYAIVNVVPWGRVKVWLRRGIDRLPPWAALGVFVIPLLVFLPVKFFEFWFIAHGNWLGAAITLVLAKVVGLGLTAFVFDVTRDKLLQMAWFHRMYDWFMWARAWAHGLVDPIKERLKRFFRLFAPKRAGRALRLFWRVRRRMQLARKAKTVAAALPRPP